MHVAAAFRTAAVRANVSNHQGTELGNVSVKGVTVENFATSVDRPKLLHVGHEVENADDCSTLLNTSHSSSTYMVIRMDVNNIAAITHSLELKAYSAGSW